MLGLLGLLLALQWLRPGKDAELFPGERFGPGRDKRMVRIEIGSPDGGDLSLCEGVGGAWYVDEDIPANEAAVRMLHSDIRHMTVRRAIAAERREEVLESLTKEGIQVDLYAASHWVRLPGGLSFLPREKRVLSFLIGSDSPDGQATYMMIVGCSKPVEVYLPGMDTSLRELFEPLPHLWFDPVVLQLQPHQIQKLSLQWTEGPGGGFTMEQEGHRGSFLVYDQDGSPVEASRPDSLRQQRFLHAFSRLVFQRVLPGSAESPPGDLLSDLPFMEMMVEDREGDKVFLQFYRRRRPVDGTLQSDYREYDTNRFYLRVNGGDYKLALYHMWQPTMRRLAWFFQADELPDV